MQVLLGPIKIFIVESESWIAVWIIWKEINKNIIVNEFLNIITKLKVRANRTVLRMEIRHPRTKHAMNPLTLVLQDKDDASMASAMIPRSSSLVVAEASSFPRRARFSLSIFKRKYLLNKWPFKIKTSNFSYLGSPPFLNTLWSPGF